MFFGCCKYTLERVEEFARVLENSLPGPTNANVQERLEILRDTVYNAAMSTFRKKKDQHACRWFEAHSEKNDISREVKGNP